MPSFWQGVLPAITTPCLEDGSVDHAFLAHHVEQMMRAGRMAEAAPLYHWFLPLLRMDVVPKFVQLIKLVQSRVGLGNVRVRAPRLVLDGEELAQVNAEIDRALASKPVFPSLKQAVPPHSKS